MTFKGRVDDMLLIKGVNVFPNAVRDVVNRLSEQTTGNIRMVLPKPGPVAEPPVNVLVEHIKGLSPEQLTSLAEAIEKALHHQLRFRAAIQFESEESFEIQTGTTGKSKLVEVLNP
jgi:phenylacetate-CoA ligase